MHQATNIVNAPGPGLVRHIPLPRAPRYQSLDHWRGLACLMVVVFHASFYLTAGNDAFASQQATVVTEGYGDFIARLIRHFIWGVPMFFVISGYCIAATVDSSRRKPNPARSFFVRRFRRIFPPFWIFISVTAAIVWIISHSGFPDFFSDAVHPINDPSALTGIQLLGNWTLTESWLVHFLGGKETFFVGHAWTLCFEEQFYAVCGILLLVAPHRFFSGILVVTLASIVAKMLCKHAHLPITGFFFEGNWLVFAAGVLVYYLRNHAAPKATGVVLGIFCAGILGALGLHLSSFYVVGFSFGIILIVLQRYDSLIVGVAILRPVAWCGQICYSLYLVHWPVSKAISHGLWLAGVRGVWPTVFLVIPVALLGSIVAAWGFHVFVEKHFLNSARKSVSGHTCKTNLDDAGKSPVAPICGQYV